MSEHFWIPLELLPLLDRLEGSEVKAAYLADLWLIDVRDVSAKNVHLAARPWPTEADGQRTFPPGEYHVILAAEEFRNAVSDLRSAYLAQPAFDTLREKQRLATRSLKPSDAFAVNAAFMAGVLRATRDLDRQVRLSVQPHDQLIDVTAAAIYATKIEWAVQAKSPTCLDDLEDGRRDPLSIAVVRHIRQERRAELRQEARNPRPRGRAAGFSKTQELLVLHQIPKPDTTPKPMPPELFWLQHAGAWDSTDPPFPIEVLLTPDDVSFTSAKDLLHPNKTRQVAGRTNRLKLRTAQNFVTRPAVWPPNEERSRPV